MGSCTRGTQEAYYTSTWSYIDKTGKAVFTYWDESDRGRIKTQRR